jgi:hypothetical protein
MREKELKKSQEEAKRLEKEKKKAEQAALLEQRKVKPSEMFLKETEKYSQFDDKVKCSELFFTKINLFISRVCLLTIRKEKKSAKVNKRSS